MDEYWRTMLGRDEGVPPFDGSRLERVVPAAGDPEVEYYRNSGRPSGLPPRYWPRAAGRRAISRRRHMRGWLSVVVVGLLALMLLKPLVALIAIGIAVFIALLIATALAVGAVFLALRLAFGGIGPSAPGDLRGMRLRPWYQLVRAALRRR